MGEKKLYFIGIDSTPLWIINELKRKYDLSGFEHFANNGILKEMKSTVPPVTSAAWPSIYTGLEPNEHQILEFSKIDSNYNKQLIYYDSSSPRPFWEALASKGFKCLVITPAVFLEDKKMKNVDMITGWPLKPRYSSRELEAQARRFMFDGEPDIGIQLNSGRLSLSKASQLYTKSIRARAKLAQHLISTKEYDMVFVCFTETDRMQHYALSEKDWERTVAPLYVAISDFMNWIFSFSKNNPTKPLLMVASDHGAQPTHHKFLPNSWLVEKGYAELRGDLSGAAKPKLGKSEKGIAKKIKVAISERMASSSMRRKIYDRLPASLQKMGEKFVEENLDQGEASEYLKILETDFDMKNTRAFASVSNGNMGMIWINDKRFSRPAVSAREKGALKKELIAELKGAKSIEKGKLMDNVYDAGKFYRNVTKFIAPDIVFQLTEGYTNDFSHYSKSFFVKPEAARRGDHTMFGIFGMVGMSAQASASMKKSELNLCNIAPTITKYFGIKGQSRNSLI
ncbi:MAG: alkaline phosphatase family protein [Candidatus Micrarchaeota archaeon]|nr:alkaline phosphatase family protein [Candidatus Micrarchaeota archaeon]